MRTPIAFLLALLMSVASISPANATVKPGAKCNKLNATATTSGKKYTCIKSGTKYIWSKGVLIKKAETLRAGICPQMNAIDQSSGISEARANSLVRMKEVKAEECAGQLGWVYRIASRDGEDYPATLDYRLDRVSVTIKDGVISRVIVG